MKTSRCNGSDVIHTVADKGKSYGKRGKDPEVVIPIRPTPDVTAMAASDMATKGSDNEEDTLENNSKKQGETPANRLIQSMDKWLEERTKEVEMIQSFLKRGFDWPSQKQLR